MKYLEAKQLRQDYENKALTGAPENKAKTGLESVEFASSQARALAEEHSLGPGDFQGRQPSGSSGFTVADVREIAEA
jgi:hypothetical protein